MEIKQTDDSKHGHFAAMDNNRQAGLMTYTWAGETKMIIDHTEVNPDYSGRGVGKKMVMAAVEYARKQNIKILPLCPFAKSVFMKDKELHDVLV